MDKELRQIAAQLTAAFYAGSERQKDLTPEAVLETFSEFLKKVEKQKKEIRKPGKLHAS